MGDPDLEWLLRLAEKFFAEDHPRRLVLLVLELEAPVLDGPAES